MTIFDENIENTKRQAPLAARMRPQSLEEWVGQEHIIGKNTLLARAIRADKLGSLVFYGPPGTGKTTLASVISATTQAVFLQLNATAAGVKDIQKAIEEAKAAAALYGKRTILFIDEIHRFNKLQQDALLPYVENGTIILIGATTENPYFEVNKALVSRSMIFELKPLSRENILKLLSRALKDKERGLGEHPIDAEENALDFLADKANGDARAALNALELAALTTKPNTNGRVPLTLEVAAECIQKRALMYERNGDNHYDTISAFIKSMRGSDPDAAVYYLARMIYAGEDPRFIARRIVICASEDIGNADPHALQVAVSAAQAVQFIGMPESQLILSQAAIYLACAPKSNACTTAITAALADVEGVQINSIPSHLQDAHYQAAPALNRGTNYKYPHAYPNNYVPQSYLPDELQHRTYYNPTENGVEKKIKESLKNLRPNRTQE
ncbi:MAG: replication-associated recombination protein A [Defluviitaleaceae bacterium]|nr:replication-associated recombination protein A [Defluviitaleaceae bacterium]MCL2262224.1 replication-associated recombination protein A [Defluviitaleaceae bacterium]